MHFCRQANQPDHSLSLASWRRQCGQTGQREGERGCSRHLLGWGEARAWETLACRTRLLGASSLLHCPLRAAWSQLIKKGVVDLCLQAGQRFSRPEPGRAHPPLPAVHRTPLALPSTDRLLHPKFEHSSLRKAVFEKPALLLSLTPSPE